MFALASFSILLLCPLPFLLAVILTNARPAVILNLCWRSSSPLPNQRSSYTPPAGDQIHPAATLHLCWQSTSLFPFQRSSSTTPAGGHIHTWLPAQRSSCNPPAGGHIHPVLPSGHPLTILLSAGLPKPPIFEIFGSGLQLLLACAWGGRFTQGGGDRPHGVGAAAPLCSPIFWLREL